VSVKFEENIASDLDNFVTAVSRGWDDKRDAEKWAIYFIGLHVATVFGDYRDGKEAVIESGFYAIAEERIKHLWEGSA
jgi:hypothetical protein